MTRTDKIVSVPNTIILCALSTPEISNNIELRKLSEPITHI